MWGKLLNYNRELSWHGLMLIRNTTGFHVKYVKMAYLIVIINDKPVIMTYNNQTVDMHL